MGLVELQVGSSDTDGQVDGDGSGSSGGWFGRRNEGRVVGSRWFGFQDDNDDYGYILDHDDYMTRIRIGMKMRYKMFEDLVKEEKNEGEDEEEDEDEDEEKEDEYEDKEVKDERKLGNVGGGTKTVGGLMPIAWYIL